MRDITLSRTEEGTFAFFDNENQIVNPTSEELHRYVKERGALHSITIVKLENLVGDALPLYTNVHIGTSSHHSGDTTVYATYIGDKQWLYVSRYEWTVWGDEEDDAPRGLITITPLGVGDATAEAHCIVLSGKLGYAEFTGLRPASPEIVAAVRDNTWILDN